MIGLRVTPRIGMRVGGAFGISDDETGTLASLAQVTRDATSNIYVPANAAEWTTFRSALALAVGSPDALWLCQEASGNLADTIGALPETATATLNYQQAVAGWTRTMVASTDAGNGKAVLASGTGPSPATTSQVWLAIVSMPATPAANRVFFGINTPSASNACRLLHLTATGNLRLNVVGVNTDGGSYSSGVHVFLLRYDRANSVANCYTDAEKLVGTYSGSATDGDKGMGNAGAGTSSARGLLYSAMWQGANAENFTDANSKALLQGMGFTIAWS